MVQVSADKKIVDNHIKLYLKKFGNVVSIQLNVTVLLPSEAETSLSAFNELMYTVDRLYSQLCGQHFCSSLLKRKLPT